MALKGFIELLRLEHMAKSRQADSQSKSEVQWQGVAFAVAGEPLVAPIGEVAEVISVPDKITAVPFSKPWLIGIANVRGQILPIVDLAGFLKVDSKARKDKLLVIKHLNLQVGLLVDKVWNIKNFSTAQYVAKRPGPSSAFIAYNHGQFKEEAQNWPVFLPSLLIQDPRFLQATI